VQPSTRLASQLALATDDQEALAEQRRYLDLECAFPGATSSVPMELVSRLRRAACIHATAPLQRSDAQRPERLRACS
jgi:hypothetical protein